MRKYLLAIFILVQVVEAQRGPSPVFVKKAKSEEVVNKLLVSGNLQAAKVVEVAGIEGGRVEEVSFKAGDVIKSGQVLARIDERRIKHDLEENKAELVRLVTGVSRVAQELKVMMADLAALEAAEEKFKGAVSEKDLRAAKLKVAVATANLAELKATQGTIEVKIKKLNTALEDCVIKAPFDGVILVRHIVEGAWLAAGGTVAKVQSYELEAVVEIPERVALENIKVENISIFGNDNKALKIKELRIKPEVDRESRNYSVIVSLTDSANLLSGMSVSAEIPTGVVEKQLLIATDAIQRNATGYFVYKVIPGQEGTVVVPVAVQILFRAGSESAVKSVGIQAGDEIVVEGNERLFPMTPVKATVLEK